VSTHQFWSWVHALWTLFAIGLIQAFVSEMSGREFLQPLQTVGGVVLVPVLLGGLALHIRREIRK